MIPLIATAIGIFIGIWMPYNLTPDMAPYVAIAIVAALDSVFGGFTARIQKRFDMLVFFTGFFSNALLAAGFVYLGNLLGISLITIAVVVVFVWRIFQNLAVMRYAALDKYSEYLENKEKLAKVEAEFEAKIADEADKETSEEN